MRESNVTMLFGWSQYFIFQLNTLCKYVSVIASWLIDLEQMI